PPRPTLFPYTTLFRSIAELAGLETTRNLIRVFFLQEHAKKSSAPASAKIERAAVIGAGVMGAGIAHWLGTRGLRVVLRDVDPARDRKSTRLNSSHVAI